MNLGRPCVDANFPGYADSFELYRTMPVRAEGAVITPTPDDAGAWYASVEYRLRPASSGAGPDLQIGLTEEPDHVGSPWPWEEGAPERPPLRTVTQVLSTGLTRQATNWAYRWLTDDQGEGASGGEGFLPWRGRMAVGAVHASPAGRSRRDMARHPAQVPGRIRRVS
ncbi:hypothetical protein A6A07_30950 [Streptomyces sp. CB03911]|nr:hypothetical protein A6A07_30950 [Streptomyces sp. CB03911]